ncbi:MAG: type II secretion system secretin GspD [Thermodesulfobacteriota bacterium]
MISIKMIKVIPVWLLVFGMLFVAGNQACAVENDTVDNRITVNFQDVDIATVISSVSRITGRTFIVDPRVKGKVTIMASQDVAEDELYSIFLSILQVHEFAAIEDGGVVKIVPLARVKHDSSALEFGRKRTGARPADSVVTRLYKLKHVPADKLVAILRPLVASKSYLAAQVDSNMLIISDRAANIKRLLKIVEQVDQPRAGDLEIIKLEYADARDVVQIIEGLEGKSPKGGRQDVRLISDSRTNSILLSGTDSKVLKIKTLVSYLDTPVESEGATQVVFLRFAKAKDLLPILQGGGFDEKGKAKAPKGVKSAGGLGGVELNIQADESTNALILTAPPAVAKNILAVIRKLDIRRPQVMIEAVIAEVATGAGAELGVQWRATDVASSNDSGVIGGTSFSSSNVPNINGLSSGTVSEVAKLGTASGFNLGFLDGATDLLGFKGLNLGALVSALASDTDTNILSTPSLVTMDNEEAEIIVGQNVPFSTGSYTSTGSTNPTNPFTTYERQDVGLQLKVVPQINEGDTIRLDIELEVSNLVVDNSEVGLKTTSTRKITTSVMVDDVKILVLGGLISDDIQEVEHRVPLLGSIPLLGWLFRYSKTTHDKRNLMLFLRPNILRDSEANNRITFNKYDYMRRVQQDFNDNGIALMPDAQAPVLPENMLAE